LHPKGTDQTQTQMARPKWVGKKRFPSTKAKHKKKKLKKFTPGEKSINRPQGTNRRGGKIRVRGRVKTNVQSREKTIWGGTENGE